ncbi:hypothetical protein CU098_001444, partial [Rhizopus stolonifer]
IIEDLFSYNTINRKRVLEYYFFQDSTYASPSITVSGVDHIQHLYTVWEAFNRTQPTITNIVFDGQTAVIHFIHNVSPTIIPWINVQVPALTTLYFKETETDSGLLKVYKQEDSWTLEGLIQAIPIVSFWYNHVLRVFMGKLLATTGDILNSAYMHANKITSQSKEMQQLGQGLTVENLQRLEYDSRSWKECYIETFDDEDSITLQEHIYLEEQ